MKGKVTHKIVYDYYGKGRHKILCGFGESEKVYINQLPDLSENDSAVTCKKCLKIMGKQVTDSTAETFRGKVKPALDECAKQEIRFMEKGKTEPEIQRPRYYPPRI